MRDRPAALDRAGHLADLGDVAASRSALPGLVHQPDVDEEVDVVRDLAVGLVDGEHAALRHPRREPVHRRVRRVGVRRAQRSRTGLHRLEHRRRLAAADLAHDQPGQVLAQRLGHQVGDRELADARAGRQSRRDRPGPAARGCSPARAAGGSSARSRSPGCRTARSAGIELISARSSVVLPAPWSPEMTMDLRASTAASRNGATSSGIRPPVDQVRQGHVGQQVLPDHDAGPVGEPEADRVQPEALPEREGHGRVGVVERSGRLAVLTEEPDGVDQLLVAVGDRRHLLAATVAVLHDHRVPAVDLDVLHVGQLQQRLQPTVAEDGVLDGVRRRPAPGWATRARHLRGAASGRGRRPPGGSRTAPSAAGRRRPSARPVRRSWLSPSSVMAADACRRRIDHLAPSRPGPAALREPIRPDLARRRRRRSACCATRVGPDVVGGVGSTVVGAECGMSSSAGRPVGGFVDHDQLRTRSAVRCRRRTSMSAALCSDLASGELVESAAAGAGRRRGGRRGSGSCAIVAMHRQPERLADLPAAVGVVGADHDEAGSLCSGGRLGLIDQAPAGGRGRTSPSAG